MPLVGVEAVRELAPGAGAIGETPHRSARVACALRRHRVGNRRRVGLGHRRRLGRPRIGNRHFANARHRVPPRGRLRTGHTPAKAMAALVVITVSTTAIRYPRPNAILAPSGVISAVSDHLRGARPEDPPAAAADRCATAATAWASRMADDAPGSGERLAPRGGGGSRCRRWRAW